MSPLRKRSEEGASDAPPIGTISMPIAVQISIWRATGGDRLSACETTGASALNRMARPAIQAYATHFFVIPAMRAL